MDSPSGWPFGLSNLLHGETSYLMQHSFIAPAIRWTATNLELFEGDRRNYYEIIDGELFVNQAPTWRHQTTCIQVARCLGNWVADGGFGQVAWGPGILFSEMDVVIPDIVWATNPTLANFLDESDRLISAPELVVEILSAETLGRYRKLDAKIKLYSRQGVREYWLCDFLAGFVARYRRENGILTLAVTLFSDDTLTSPLLPGFNCKVAEFFV